MPLKRTPLYERHRKLGARLIEFGGYRMPLQYAGILEEHRAVRTSVGVFDVSHMGKIELRGPGALDLVQRLIPNDAGALEVHQVLYSPMCDERGGTVDDLLVYRLEDRYLLVVNASNTEKDLRWVRQNARAFRVEVEVQDASRRWAQLAVQGPEAQEALQPFVEADLSRLHYYRSTPLRLFDRAALLSRTGYTGEDGFEVYAPPEAVLALWDALLAAGVPPIGLGARDSLRFEAALPLYGHELSEEVSPVEAGLAWTVKEKPHPYNGKAVLLRQKRQGAPRRLVGLKMTSPGVPRQGYIVIHNSRPIGTITSGMKAPTVGAFLGLALVRSGSGADLEPGAAIEVEIRGRPKAAQVVALPFYQGSVRRGPS